MCHGHFRGLESLDVEGRWELRVELLERVADSVISGGVVLRLDAQSLGLLDLLRVCCHRLERSLAATHDASYLLLLKFVLRSMGSIEFLVTAFLLFHDRFSKTARRLVVFCYLRITCRVRLFWRCQ